MKKKKPNLTHLPDLTLTDYVFVPKLKKKKKKKKKKKRFNERAFLSQRSLHRVRSGLQAEA